MLLLEHYVNRATRDARASELKRQGYSVTKRASRNQVISPDYVEDYTGYRSPNGFGGSSGRYFSHLYTIEAR